MGSGKKMLLCPKGHRLPHETEIGQCTPLDCAAVRMKKKKTTSGLPGEKKQRAPSPKVMIRSHVEELRKTGTAPLPEYVQQDPLLKADAEDGRNEELSRISSTAGKWAARRSFIPIPAHLKPEEIDVYFTNKMSEMLPEAIATIEEGLKYGETYKERREAALDVMDAKGLRKKEATVGGVSVFQFIGTGVGIQPSWTSKPILGSKQIEEAQIIEVAKANEKDNG